MKKTIALLLCLVLAACAVSAGAAESGANEADLIAEWAEQTGDSLPWDYRVNARFAEAHSELWENPTDRPVLPDENDPETISPEKAKKLAYRLIPEYGTEITADTLFSLTCVVGSYRKPDHLGSFFQPSGSWEVDFWDTKGAEPRFVCSIYIDARNEWPDVFLLASGVRYEIQYEGGPSEAVRIDPAGNNTTQGRARLEARNVAAERFSADYGFDDYFAGLLSSFGPFRTWTPAQKYEYCNVLDELLYWESARMSLYHIGRPVRTNTSEGPILEWGYGDPSSAAIPEEEARRKALDFLQDRYDMDCADCQVSVSLYTGHWHNDPFVDPWWVMDYYDGEDRKAEVWVSAATGTMPKYRMDDAEAVTREQFAAALEEGYEVGGVRVTEDMIDNVSVVYLEEENEWYGIVAVGDSYWEIAIDADTLECLDTERSNG